MDNLIGISCGLLAALFSSFSYLGSRFFLTKHPGGSKKLLVLSHVWMGLFSLPTLALTYRGKVPPIENYLLILLICVGCYLIAQLALFTALKRVDASRVAPLLGLKIAILALLSVFWVGHAIQILQWVAVGLSVAAAFLLNRIGGPLPKKAFFGVMTACICYALSDIHIIKLVAVLHQTMPMVQASFLASALCYVLAGLIMLPALFWQGSRLWPEWRDAIPFALAWFLSMLGLYYCFATIGVVLGSIAQATRGLISIGLGVWIAHIWNWVHLEAKVDRALFVRRVIAAVLMAGAIVLYVLGKA